MKEPVFLVVASKDLVERTEVDSVNPGTTSNQDTSNERTFVHVVCTYQSRTDHQRSDGCHFHKARSWGYGWYVLIVFAFVLNYLASDETIDKLLEEIAATISSEAQRKIDFEPLLQCLNSQFSGGQNYYD
jgi:hypothetical protein